jgi:Rieske Fe-S protein
MQSSERSRSVWESSRAQREYPPLVGMVTADVCIVGAGLAGITTAYLLGRNGQHVVVLDDNGAVLQRGASKIAVYRDDDGRLIERSAVCTHLGCIVQWNSLERSWDCPCHGSRFAPDGAVLNGPAITPLKDGKPATNR